MSDPSPDPAAARATRITLRPIGNPLPLGFLALSGGTLLLTALQLGWIDSGFSHDIAWILIAFVVPLQALSSVLGFLARDVVAGTGMGILSAMWLAIGVITATGEPGATNEALGLLLVFAAAALLVPVSAGVSGKVIPSVVMATTAVRAAVTGVFQLTAVDTWGTAAGWIGIVLAVAAFYASLALALEDVRGRTVLPLGRRAQGEEALSGPFEAELAGLHHEAGVRQQI